MKVRRKERSLSIGNREVIKKTKGIRNKEKETNRKMKERKKSRHGKAIINKREKRKEKKNNAKR